MKTQILVSNSEAVESIYGYWPYFHDAEIISINLERDSVNQSGKVTVVVSYSESKTINEGTAEFDTIRHKDTLITLEFNNLSKLAIERFNHQNVIDELVLNKVASEIEVEFISIYGVGIELTCKTITVIEVRSA